MCISISNPTTEIRLLTVDRPSKRNALNIRAYEELDQPFKDAGQDADVGVLVMTGANPVFTRGNDLTDFRQHPDSLSGHKVLHSLHTLDKPTIAAIEGFAIGIVTDRYAVQDLKWITFSRKRPNVVVNFANRRKLNKYFLNSSSGVPTIKPVTSAISRRHRPSVEL